MSRVNGACLDPCVPMIFLDEARLACHLSQAPVKRNILLRCVGDCSSSVHTKEEGIYNPSCHRTRWAQVNVHEENKQVLLRVTCVASVFVIAEARFVVHGTCWLCDAAARAARGERRCRWRVAMRPHEPPPVFVQPSSTSRPREKWGSVCHEVVLESFQNKLNAKHVEAASCLTTLNVSMTPTT